MFAILKILQFSISSSFEEEKEGNEKYSSLAILKNYMNPLNPSESEICVLSTSY